MGGHGGRGGLFCSGLCVFVSVCVWAALQAALPSLLPGLH